MKDTTISAHSMPDRIDPSIHHLLHHLLLCINYPPRIHTYTLQIRSQHQPISQPLLPTRIAITHTTPPPTTLHDVPEETPPVPQQHVLSRFPADQTLRTLQEGLLMHRRADRRRQGDQRRQAHFARRR